MCSLLHFFHPLLAWLTPSVGCWLPLLACWLLWLPLPAARERRRDEEATQSGAVQGRGGGGEEGAQGLTSPSALCSASRRVL